MAAEVDILINSLFNSAGFTELSAKLDQVIGLTQKVADATSKSFSSKSAGNLTRALNANTKALKDMAEAAKSTAESMKNIASGATAVREVATAAKDAAESTRGASEAFDGIRVALQEASKAGSTLVTALMDQEKVANQLTKAEEGLAKAKQELTTAEREYEQAQLRGNAAGDELAQTADRLKVAQTEYQQALRTATSVQNQAETATLRYSQALLNQMELEQRIAEIEGEGEKVPGRLAEAYAKVSEQISAYQMELTKMGEAQQRANQIVSEAAGVKDQIQSMQLLRKETESFVNTTTQVVGTVDGIRVAMQNAATDGSVLARSLLTQDQAMRTLGEAERSLAQSTTALNEAQRAYNEMQASASASTREKAQAAQQLTKAQADLRAAMQGINSVQSQAVSQSDAYTRALQEQATLEQHIADIQRAGEAVPQQLSTRYQTLTEQIRAYEQALIQLTEIRTRANTLQNEAATQKGAVENVQLLQKETLSLVGANQNAAASVSVLSKVLEGLRGIFGSVAAAAKNFASTLAAGVVGGIDRASSLIGKFADSAGSMFSRLRSSLDATGQGFLRFGSDAEKGMNQAGLGKSAAGWSLLMGGQMISQYGHGLLDNLTGGLSNYTDYESQALKAAIAGNTSIDDITNMVTGIERGKFQGQSLGQPVYILDSTELAQGIYYAASAAGMDLSTPENQLALSKFISPVLHTAAYTGTSPQDMMKGVIQAGQEFGFDIQNPNQFPYFQQIGALMGYMANATTLEVPDIIKTFSYIGPYAHMLEGSNPGAGLADTMAATWLASNMGLKGSSVGRGIGRVFSSLLDPTDKMIALGSSAFGFDPSKEGWMNYFFDPNGHLKGGFGGFLQNFVGGSPQQNAKMNELLASLFTENATRTVIAAVAQLRNKKNPDGTNAFDDVIKKLTSGNAQEAMDILNKAIAKSNDTIGGHLQNLKNSWFQVTSAIVGNIKGPFNAGLEVAATAFQHLADLFKDNPIFGKLLTGAVAGLGGFLAVLGSLVTAAGGIVILENAMKLLGGAGSEIMAVFPALFSLFLKGIPVFGLLGAAAIGLYEAWSHNLFGVQDIFNDWSTNFGQKVNSVIVPAVEKAEKVFATLGLAYAQFVVGILGGSGSTATIEYLLTSVFGNLIGGTLYEGLLKFRDALQPVRDGIKDFFTGLEDGVNVAQNLSNAYQAVQLFFESVLFGITSLEHIQAADAIGKALGIDGLAEKLYTAGQVVQQGIKVALDAINAFRKALAQPLGDIVINVKSIISMDTLEGALELLKGLIEGFAAGFASTILGAVKALDLLSQGLANAGTAGRWIRDQIQDWTGYKATLEDVGRIVGVVFGTLFAGRILAAIAPINALITATAKIGLTFAQAGTQLVAWGTQLGLVAAKMIVLTAALVAQGALFVARAAAVTVATAAELAFAAAQQIVAVATGEVVLTLGVAAGLFLGLAAAALVALGVIGLIAGGIFVVVAATQGMGAALADARAFWDGFKGGLEVAAGILLTAGGAIAKFVGWLIDLIAPALSAKDAMHALGEAAGIAAAVLAGSLVAAALAAGAGAIVTLIAQISALILAFGKLALTSKNGALAFVGIGAAILLLGPHFDALFGWIQKASDMLDKLSGGHGADILTAGAIAAANPLGRKGLSTIAKVIAANPELAVVAGGAAAGYGIYELTQPDTGGASANTPRTLYGQARRQAELDAFNKGLVTQQDYERGDMSEAAQAYVTQRSEQLFQAALPTAFNAAVNPWAAAPELTSTTSVSDQAVKKAEDSADKLFGIVKGFFTGENDDAANWLKSTLGISFANGKIGFTQGSLLGSAVSSGNDAEVQKLLQQYAPSLASLYSQQSAYDQYQELVKQVGVAEAAQEYRVTGQPIPQKPTQAQVNAAGEQAQQEAQAQAEAMQQYVQAAQQVGAMPGLLNVVAAQSQQGSATRQAVALQTAMTGYSSAINAGITIPQNISNQAKQVQDWADGLINVQGEYGKIDDLLNTTNEATHKSWINQQEYNDAQKAYNQIANDNARIQNDLLKIQTDQAPLIAQQTNELQNQLDKVAQMPAAQQQVVLGWMDQNEAAKANAAVTMAAAAAQAGWGDAAGAAIKQMAEADPVLKSMLEDMGLIKENSDGTITINFPNGKSLYDQLQNLSQSIEDLARAIRGLPPLEIQNNLGSTKASLDEVNQAIREYRTQQSEWRRHPTLGVVGDGTSGYLPTSGGVVGTHAVPGVEPETAGPPTPSWVNNFPHGAPSAPFVPDLSGLLPSWVSGPTFVQPTAGQGDGTSGASGGYVPPTPPAPKPSQPAAYPKAPISLPLPPPPPIWTGPLSPIPIFPQPVPKGPVPPLNYTVYPEPPKSLPLPPPPPASKPPYSSYSQGSTGRVQTSQPAYQPIRVGEPDFKLTQAPSTGNAGFAQSMGIISQAPAATPNLQQALGGAAGNAVKITADTSDFMAKWQQVANAISGLGKMQAAQVKFTADTSGFMTQWQQVANAVAALGKMQATKIKFDADTSGFMTQWQQVANAVAALGKMQASKVKFEADTSGFMQAWQQVANAVVALGKMSATSVKFTADAADFMSKWDSAEKAVAAFNNVSATAKLMGDITVFNGAVANANEAGQAFGNSVWTAQLWGDATVALAAISNAQSAANDFAKTYTATLDVNDNASGVIGNAIGMMNSFNGMTSTSYINTVQTTTVQTVNLAPVSLGPATPAFATGGVFNGPGPYAIVGEHGPELIELPYGTRIYNNFDTMQMLNEASQKLAKPMKLPSATSSIKAQQAPQTLALSVTHDGETKHETNLYFYGDIHATSPDEVDKFINDVAKRVDRIQGKRNRDADRGMVPTSTPRFPHA